MSIENSNLRQIRKGTEKNEDPLKSYERYSIQQKDTHKNNNKNNDGNNNNNNNSTKENNNSSLNKRTIP